MPNKNQKEKEQKKWIPPLGRSQKDGGDVDEEGAPSLWLITFTDVMALMLTFFVLLYSMSTPNEEDWEKMSDALNQNFSKFDGAQWNAGAQEINIEKLDFNEALNLHYLKALMAELIEQDQRLQGVTLIGQKDRLIVSFPHDLLFASGAADVSTRGKKILFAFGDLLARIGNRIEVMGHADPRPIQDQNKKFSSNWQLSLARAASVSGVLQDVGYIRPVIMRGLSSARYDELPDDLEEEERLSFARRVDIVIMKDDGSQRLFMDTLR